MTLPGAEMNVPVPPKRKTRLHWAIGVAFLLIPWACSEPEPNAATPGVESPPNVDRCATPNEGCPCDNPGEVVECGKVILKSGDYVSCANGHRTCIGERWGDCVAEGVTTKFVGVGTRIQALASEAGPACTDVCDPYCLNYVDDPVGITLPDGFTMADAGLTIIPPGIDAGVLPGQVQVNPGGDNTCVGGTQLHTDPCDDDPFGKCQQDFRCVANACVWNGGDGYFDPSAGGPDLTLGAPCDYGAGASFPVCNRGSETVAEGLPINIHVINHGDDYDGCNAALGTDPPHCSVPVPAGGLEPGKCINVLCNPINGNKNAVVNFAGSAGAIPEAPGRCRNNATYAKGNGGGCATCSSCITTVSGRVMDPGKNVGLSNVTVFQPLTPVGPIPDNAGGTTPPPCDNCEALLNPSNFITGVNTGIDGTFTLQQVAPGPTQIVAQAGRWRRVVNKNIPACQHTVLTDDEIRFPKNRSEGDIPKMALVMGNRESLECWLLKVGIDSNEIWPRGGTAPGSTTPNQARIQLFRTNGLGQSTGRPNPPAGTTLWAAGGPLNEYSAVILPCDSAAVDISSSDSTRMIAYANAGGRIFMDHLTGSDEWLHESSASAEWNNANIATWRTNIPSTPTNPAVGFVHGWGTTGPQNTFLNWLHMWAPWTSAATPTTPGPGPGWVSVTNPRDDGVIAGPLTTEWIRGRRENNWGPGPYSAATGNNCSGTSPPGCQNTASTYTLSFSFETGPAGPKPLPDGTTCGRVIYNGMHVSQTRATGLSGSGTYSSTTKFPSNCVLAPGLSPEEKALEYQFFQLTACSITPPTLPPPVDPPTPPPPSGPTIYTRDYRAECPPGTRAVWRKFKWNATIPGASSIIFRARTAAEEAQLDAAPVVDIGHACNGSEPCKPSTTSPPGWSEDDQTVEWHLNNDLAPERYTSQQWLRVTMEFTPDGSQAPVLYTWQQEFDCTPAE